MQKCEEGKGAASNEQRQFCSKGGKGGKRNAKKCREIMQIYHPSLPKKG